MQGKPGVAEKSAASCTVEQCSATHDEVPSPRQNSIVIQLSPHYSSVKETILENMESWFSAIANLALYPEIRFRAMLNIENMEFVCARAHA